MSKFGDKDSAVKAKTTAFGNYIDPDRTLFDAPNLALVEVDLPEYERNGLGRALLKVVRFHFTDIGAYGIEGLSVGADSSRGIMVYEDMNPRVVGLTHSQAQADAPPELVRALFQAKLPNELITIGALRHAQFGSANSLIEFIRMYHARASWMEVHPAEVRLQNMEALIGAPSEFDWARLLPEEH